MSGELQKPVLPPTLLESGEVRPIFTTTELRDQAVNFLAAVRERQALQQLGTCAEIRARKAGE